MTANKQQGNNISFSTSRAGGPRMVGGFTMQFEFHVDVYTIVTVVVLLILVCALSACTVLGTGHNTLVLAKEPAPPGIYKGKEFEYLIAKGSKRFIGLQGKNPHEPEDWEKFEKERLGGAGAKAASIDINVRDQSNTPTLEFFNIVTANAADIVKTLIDPKGSQDQKDKLIRKVRYSYSTMPEVDLSLVSHGIDEKGHEVYYYFPRITIDLTSTLNTAETLDRFDYLAAAIRIPDGTCAKFINFSPKAADLFEFTLGQLKQTAAAKASASTSNKVTTNATTGNNSTGAPGMGTSIGGELGYGGSVDFTLTDELTRDIKSSLEARSAGIMQKGKLFLVELRSNEQRRISGTYSFNVMLEVPSTAQSGTSVDKTSKDQTLTASQPNEKCITAEVHVASKDETSEDGILTWTTSQPNVKRIKAEVRLVGIVRHVVKPGKTVSFVRVPEPLNDETFRQVVLYDKKVLLWQFPEPPAGKTNPNLIVYSNIDEARFIVFDETNGKKLADGTGREAHLSIPPFDVRHKVKVVFLPATVGGDKPVMLTTPPAFTGITLGRDAYAIGNYMPTPTSKPSHTSKPSP
jgi:hypothetical protein